MITMPGRKLERTTSRFDTKIKKLGAKISETHKLNKISSAYQLGYIKQKLTRIVLASRKTANAIKKIKIYKPKLENKIEILNKEISKLNTIVNKQLMDINLRNPEKTKEYLKLQEYLRRRDELNTLIKKIDLTNRDLNKQIAKQLITKEELYNKIKGYFAFKKTKKQ